MGGLGSSSSSSSGTKVSAPHQAWHSYCIVSAISHFLRHINVYICFNTALCKHIFPPNANYKKNLTVCKWPLSLLCVMEYWSVKVCVLVPLKSLCVFLSALSTFGAANLLFSLNLLPPTSILPRTLPPHTCGPGGAGACSPEDRGSAGSQKHLSVPFPLCPKAPGTALNSAPGASECVSKERRLGKTPNCLNEADVQRVLCRARMSVFQPAPKHTVVSLTANSWPSRHGGCTTTSSVLPTSKNPSLPLPTQPNPQQKL